MAKDLVEELGTGSEAVSVRDSEKATVSSRVTVWEPGSAGETASWKVSDWALDLVEAKATQLAMGSGHETADKSAWAMAHALVQESGRWREQAMATGSALVSDHA